MSRLHMVMHNYIKVIEYTFSESRDNCGIPQVSFRTRSGEHIADLYLGDHNIKCPPPGTSTSCEETMNLARDWLNTCLLSHELCSSSKHSEAKSTDFYPSRLVYVSNERNCRLLESESLPIPLEYLTLSHCWGQEKFFTLINSNLEDLKDDIPVGKLPSVFQDALSVTLRLGYNFIWIDSICIIQDSRQDWTVESTRMGSVYKNSTCTLAATGFPNGSYGLYSTRDPTLVWPFKLKVNPQNWNREMQQTDLVQYGYFPDIWQHEIERSPLYERGWVVQERVLSPRILHFTKTQIYWECSQNRCSEVYPSRIYTQSQIGASPMNPTAHIDCKTLSVSTGRWNHESHRETNPSIFQLGYMNAIVVAHSRSKLSYPSDKLISITGIVKELQTLFKDTATAGIFHKQLPLSLLWSVSCPTIRRPEYNAPTWSWTSMDGLIDPFLGTNLSGGLLDGMPYIQSIAHVKVQPPTRDATGMSNARLQVRGHIFRVKNIKQVMGMKMPKMGGSFERHDIGDHQSVQIFADTEEFFIIIEGNCLACLYFIPLCEIYSSIEYEIVGLITLRRDMLNGKIERLGLMSVILNSKGFPLFPGYSLTGAKNPWWNMVLEESEDSSMSRLEII
ncbi:heterokaryon incompatibility protein-domain-containing protein [Paraphoma chrysanthemicola]|nr:heterokaryon incompatibility protein-domain-containing protein [Paraphoma chrysanthemicola]